MEPITFILTALTLGVAAGIKPTAEQAIKDAYAGLKTLIENRYKTSLSELEKKPESKAQVAVIEENLKDAKADKDEELFDKAKELFDAVNRYNPQGVTTKAINFNDVEADYIKIKRVLAEGAADAITMDIVKAKSIEIEDVTAVSDPKAKRQ